MDYLICLKQQRRMTKLRSNKFKIKKNSSGLVAAIFFFCVSIILVLLSLIKGKVFLSILFMFFVLTILRVIVRLKAITIFENQIVCSSFWSKKEHWRIEFNDLKKVRVNYFIDVPYRSKKIYLHQQNNSVSKIDITNIWLSELANPFLEAGVPVYVINNSKEVLYCPPSSKP